MKSPKATKLIVMRRLTGAKVAYFIVIYSLFMYLCAARSEMKVLLWGKFQTDYLFYIFNGLMIPKTLAYEE
jgi:hypothetical protein